MGLIRQQPLSPEKDNRQNYIREPTKSQAADTKSYKFFAPCASAEAEDGERARVGSAAVELIQHGGEHGIV